MIDNFTLKFKQFCSLSTVDELGAFFSVSIKTLDEILISPTYQTFQIPKKKGGFRIITSPDMALKKIQQKIALQLQMAYPKPKSVYGFVAMDKRVDFVNPIIANAFNHINKKYILSIDIHHFFESIYSTTIYHLFRSAPFHFPEKIALILTRLTTYKGCLPTGAPTSPMLSNFIMLEIDRNFEGFALKHSIDYSRYADDLTFSSNLPIEEESVNQIKKILFPFVLNPSKTRIKNQSQQQKVTGIIVNQKINIDRKWLKKLRAMLYDFKTNGLQKASFNHFKQLNKETNFINHLRGNISFLGQVRGLTDNEYIKYSTQYRDLVSKKA